MADTEQDPQIEAMWRMALTSLHKNRLAILPSAPRCNMCRVPFGGFGGAVSRLRGLHPSRKNPYMCNYCDDILPPGGAEVDLAVLFADVRGSTAMGERLGASAFAALLNRFYKASADVLFGHEALIDKMIGDEVMALFLPNVEGYRRRSVISAIELQRAVRGKDGEAWLPLGIGIYAGEAFVGKVGSGGVHDFTALGDTVNTAARIQQEAKAGEIVLAEDLYQEVSGDYPNAEQRTVTLRGKEGPLTLRVLKPA